MSEKRSRGCLTITVHSFSFVEMQSQNNIPYSSTWFLYFCEINGLVHAKISGLSQLYQTPK